MSLLTNDTRSLDAQVRSAEKVIDSSGVVERIEATLALAKKKSGRPSELSVRSLLVVLLVLGGSGRMHLIRVPRLIDTLPQATKKRLGLVRDGGITRRQVERLFANIASALEASSVASASSRWSQLDALCDALLQASAHPEAQSIASVAIDGTAIESWGRVYRRELKQADGSIKRVKLASDPDARWRGRGESAWKRPFFGYDATVAVTVPEVGGEAVPMAALTMRYRPAAKEPVQGGVMVAQAIFNMQGRLGDVLVDREYTKHQDGSGFILPVRALGGEPIFDLTEQQRGARGTVKGAVMIDGHPFSPGVPHELFHLGTLPVQSTREQKIEHQEKMAARAIYAMRPHGSRKTSGAWTMQCPASASKLLCPLQKAKGSPRPGALPIHAKRVPVNVAKGDVCSQSYTTFDAHEIPLSQRELYGTAEWYFSFSRRNRVEGFFGNTKNEAVESLRRGSVRVLGGYKSGLLHLLMMAATNMRFAKRWDEQSAVPPARRKKMGRPRKAPIAHLAQIILGADQPQAPPSS